MKDKASPKLDAARINYEGHESEPGDLVGLYRLRIPGTGTYLVEFSEVSDWHRLSVSSVSGGQPPTQSVMDQVRDLFFDPGEVAVEFHVTAAPHKPPKNMRQLWRPKGTDVSLPGVSDE